MENYHKIIGGIILVAFFAALSFYLQKAAFALHYFVHNTGVMDTINSHVAKTIVGMVINFIR